MKKLMILIALALVAALTLVGCASGTAASDESSIQKISPEDAKVMMDTSGVIVFDVRTQSEYDAGHIDGAILLPYDTITADSADLPADKTTPVMVYCRSGSRSSTAANTLAELGYTQVYDLGGLQSWPYDIVN